MVISKQLKQRILDGEYVDILKKRATSRFKATGELSDKHLAQILLKDQMALTVALNSPQEHHTIDLGIRAFKRWLKVNMPHLTKGQVSAQIKKYKERAWQDFAELVEFNGSHPTAKVNVNVTTQ